jgi:hypothetical protein
LELAFSKFSDLTAIKVAAAVEDSTGRIKVAVPGLPGIIMF